MKLKILFLYLFILVFILTLFSTFIYFNPENKISQRAKDIFPIQVKSFIRDYFFIISEKNKEIDQLKKFSIQLIKKQNNSLEDKFLNISSKEIINKKYELYKYSLPFYNRLISNKTVAHIDIYKNKLIFVTGNGQFFYLEKNEILQNKLNLKKINNNLTEIIKDIRFYDNSKIFLNSDEISVKDILIDNNIVYISYIREVSPNCFNTSILSSDFKKNSFNFDIFYTYDECLSFKNVKEFNGQQSGGRLVKFDNKILLTTGEYRKRELAQNSLSKFGKILEIDLNKKSSKIFSLGHRNPQGLFVDNDLDLIFSTEHGPYGGDEINLIEKNNNYGWPISSYGDHYDGTFKKSAPLHKSHKKYGFTEPLKYFYPSIGISEITKINEISNPQNNYYFVSSLKDKTLYLMKYDIVNKRFVEKDKLKINERIRDIIFDEDRNLYYMILENNPSFGIIKFK